MKIKKSERLCTNTMKVNRKHYQKVKTRTHIIESALRIMADGKSLDSLSLREVTRDAGIVPGGFYRHFQNMDEMGLAIVDDVSHKLRGILREARREGALSHIVLSSSISIFFDYVKENRLLFSFIYRERSGGNKRVRLAIQNEMKFFAAELALDLGQSPVFRKLPVSELEFLSEFVISTAFTLSGEFLDIKDGDLPRETELAQKAVRQLKYIYRGGFFSKKQFLHRRKGLLKQTRNTPRQ
ncbi:MAG: TetR family transcriptional regulator [Leptospiraceae bacterium]|nr:TetR family transcriptional regulator [Leptospiraceae bacterium]